MYTDASLIGGQVSGKFRYLRHESKLSPLENSVILKLIHLIVQIGLMILVQRFQYILMES